MFYTESDNSLPDFHSRNPFHSHNTRLNLIWSSRSRLTRSHLNRLFNKILILIENNSTRVLLTAVVHALVWRVFTVRRAVTQLLVLDTLVSSMTEELVELTGAGTAFLIRPVQTVCLTITAPGQRDALSARTPKLKLTAPWHHHTQAKYYQTSDLRSEQA